MSYRRKLLLAGTLICVAGCGVKSEWTKTEEDWIAQSLRVFVPDDATTKVCQLHRTKRTNEVVPVIYGTPDPADPYFTARRASFPNSWSHLSGGCVFATINGRSPDTQAVVKVCGPCRDAENGWIKSHR